jgi:hypothetical protein
MARPSRVVRRARAAPSRSYRRVRPAGPRRFVVGRDGRVLLFRGLRRGPRRPDRSAPDLRARSPRRPLDGRRRGALLRRRPPGARGPRDSARRRASRHPRARGARPVRGLARRPGDGSAPPHRRFRGGGPLAAPAQQSRAFGRSARRPRGADRTGRGAGWGDGLEVGSAAPGAIASSGDRGRDAGASRARSRAGAPAPGKKRNFAG